ncbi:hypothetical protein LAZ67_3005807 [Cordylochernes scorpioides]|uniref:Uncharacterized protein n=1 Tax=Cordylochernes scorpioides TaxID=51811 RepID=A0ABY6KE16_9ARAC|nr:hypothetical protein LAZ67_3005807 [Cordylochernes scorpioides]
MAELVSISERHEYQHKATKRSKFEYTPSLIKFKIHKKPVVVEVNGKSLIKFNAKLGKSESETFILMKQVYSKLCLSESNVFIWHSP